MKKLYSLILFFISLQGFGQTDSIIAVPISIPVIVHRDFRLDILARKEAELNAAAAIVNKAIARTAMGYRLQVLSTNDRDLAMKTRTQLLQRYPDQKPYMIFQAPYLKLTFGNFLSRQEAELYKKQISQMLGGASVYILSQRIEIKPEKEIKDPEK